MVLEAAVAVALSSQSPEFAAAASAVTAKTDAETQTAPEERLAEATKLLADAERQLSSLDTWLGELDAVVKRKRQQLAPGYVLHQRGDSLLPL